MLDERLIRVWIDDHNPVFRLGLAACLESPRYLLTGESASLTPRPDLARTDILVFELDETGLGEAIRLTAESGKNGSGTRLITISPRPDDELLVEAVQAGVAGALIRGDITPASLLHCLRAVAGGNGSLPAAVLPNLVGGGRGGRRGGSAEGLTGRELNVLKLLSQGENTRQIAEDLCYSEKTVKNIVHDLLIRMNCRNRAQVVALATRRGLI